MAFLKSQCSLCKKEGVKIWPVKDGVCERCLVVFFTLEEAKKDTNTDSHGRLTEIFSEKRKRNEEMQQWDF